jgi:hypothetical protein
MKSLLRFALGAALAGALVNIFLNEQSRRQSPEDSLGVASTSEGPLSSYDLNQASDPDGASSPEGVAQTSIPTRTARAVASQQASEGADET